MVCSLIPPPSPPPGYVNKRKSSLYKKQMNGGQFFNAQVVYADKKLYENNEMGVGVHTGFIDIDEAFAKKLKKNNTERLLITTHLGGKK